MQRMADYCKRPQPGGLGWYVYRNINKGERCDPGQGRMYIMSFFYKHLMPLVSDEF